MAVPAPQPVEGPPCASIALRHQLLGLDYTRVVDRAFADDSFVTGAARTCAYLRNLRCSSWGHRYRGEERAQDRQWRYLDAVGRKLYLCYGTRRVGGIRCGVTVEHLPWAGVGAWFTRSCEDHVGQLAQ